MTVRAEAQIDLARVDDGAAGQNGATFTPSVDAAGDISWTNDGGLPNPQTQNIMGPQGDPGAPGTNGVSVTAVEPQYYLSTSDSSATGGSWSSTPATFVSGCYYWTRDYITFSDGTHDTSTEVYNAGMTQAAQDAYDALTLADDTNQYFWYAPTGADTGAHITEVPQDEWNDSSDPNYHSGGNLLARTNGIAIRNGMDELATFGATSARIGSSNADNLELSSQELVFSSDYQGNVIPIFKIVQNNNFPYLIGMNQYTNHLFKLDDKRLSFADGEGSVGIRSEPSIPGYSISLVPPEDFSDIILGRCAINDLGGFYIFGDHPGIYINDAPLFQAGHKSVGTINTNSYTDVALSFSPRFNNTPHVTATLSSSGTAGNIGNVCVSVFGISTSGATVRVFNNRGASMSPDIEWIAIGV